MNEKLFKDRYRIDSIRLKDWDYRSEGAYFITICTKNRECLFGEIKNQKTFLSNTGKIAEKYWIDIPKHFGHVELDAFVIMPNHIHGIIIINEIYDDRDVVNNGGRDVACNVSTEADNEFMSTISPKSKSLSVVIRSYKSAVKQWCNKNNHCNFSWQERFYEHIIKDEEGLNRIRRYILNNPRNWDFDRNNNYR